MRVIISGTREGVPDEKILQRMMLLPDGCTIIEGGARGVDRQAAGIVERAPHKKFKHECFPADWETYGKVAGPIRNQRMLDAGADLVLAFPGPASKGTWDMVRRAEKAGIVVEVVR